MLKLIQPADTFSSGPSRRSSPCLTCGELIEIGDLMSHNIEKHGFIDFKNLPYLKKAEMLKKFMTHYDSENFREGIQIACITQCGSILS